VVFSLSRGSLRLIPRLILALSMVYGSIFSAKVDVAGGGVNGYPSAV